jgi:hypothetical protein
MRPDTSYARDGDVHIAYQVLQGSGSRDLLLVPEFWHSIEAMRQPILSGYPPLSLSTGTRGWRERRTIPTAWTKRHGTMSAMS